MSATRLDRWLAPRIATRATDTAREIAADPTTLTVRRQNRGTDLTITARVVPGGTLATRTGGEASAETQARVTILAPAGTDLRRGDRAHDTAGNVYLVTYVSPGQEWRTEASALVEQ